MTPPVLHRRGRRRAPRKLAVAIGASALLALTTAAPAFALNFVTNTNGDSWGVQDASIPGVDTGSVRNTGGGALQGFGGLRMQVSGSTPPSRMDGVLLRGFGLKFDGINRFKTTTAVGLDGVAVERSLLINRQDSWARFFDSFTNTGRQAVTVEVAFGGQLGYGTGFNQTTVASTSSGDTTITPTDAWAVVRSPGSNPLASNNGPSAVVIGTPGTRGLTRTGNFLVDPFTEPLATTGEQANHFGYVNRFTLQAGEKKSLARFVAIGLSEVRPLTSGATVPAVGSQVTAVTNTATTLAATPSFSDLSAGELCTLANWDVAALTVPGFSAADCTFAKAPEPTAILPADSPPTTSSRYDVNGKSLTELQADMVSGKTTSQEITRAYLDRIAAYNGGPFGFHAIITVNPTAMEQAKAADVARAKGQTGALLGIPVAAKDLYDTKDMKTTGGSLVFENYQPKKDSFQVGKLRDAGAVILAKANLAEYATDGHFSPSAFGQVWNAFDASKSSIGSSGGSAVALATSMAAVTLGSQTGDSLWGPSSAASLVSLRGTDGMQSADGVMPLTYIQDYAGIIARTLPDLASTLNVAAVANPTDPETQAADAHRPANWNSYLKADALQGKTIGVPASAFTDPFGTTATTTALKATFASFQAAGATIKNIGNPPPSPASVPGDRGYEGWRRWLLAHPDNPYTDVSEITQNQKRVPNFRAASLTYTGTGPMTEAQVQAFRDYRKNYRQILADWMDANGVDATVFPGMLSDIHLNDSIQPSFGRLDPQSSASGVPTVIFPAGVNDHGEPMNLQLQGRAWSDPELLGYAYAYDQINQGHRETTLAPSLKFVEGSQPQPIVIDKPTVPITTPPAGTPAPVSEANAAPGVQQPAPTPAAAVKTGVMATVKATKVTATKRGAFSLRVSCPAAATKSCTVKVTTSRSGKTIGSKTVTVRPGKTKSVSFKTTSAIKRSLARGSKVKVSVKLTGLKGTAVAAKTTVTVIGRK